MTTDNPTPTTPNKRQEFAAAIADRILLALPEDVNETEIGRAFERLDEIAAPSATLALSIIRPPPKPTIPDRVTLGGRTFIVPQTIADGEVVSGPTMIERAKQAKAASGKDACEWFLSHQEELNAQIPLKVRGRVTFVFVDWRHPHYSDSVAIVYWNGARWVQYWYWLDDVWRGRNRPVGVST